jgi:hypothetical protein
MRLNSWAFTLRIVVKHVTAFSLPVKKSAALHMSMLVTFMVVVSGLAVAFHCLVPGIQGPIVCSGHQHEIDHSAPNSSIPNKKLMTLNTDETSCGNLDVAGEEKLL